MSQRRVVCAAIRAADGTLLLGIRHYSTDMHNQLSVRADREKFKCRHGDDQGFVDQFGVYLTRKEAWIVAEAAGQIVRRCGGDGEELFSENLY